MNPLAENAPVTTTNSPEGVTRLTDEEAEKVLPREFWPNIDHLVFEDGKPLDSLFTERQQRLLVAPLYAVWEGPPGTRMFAAMSNVGLFVGPNIPHQVPDAMLSAGVRVPRDPRPRAHHSYLIWMYGKAPDVVIEVVSDRRGGELTHKFQAYCRCGVPNYVVYDPEQYLGNQVLHIFHINRGEYIPSPEAWFPTVGLGLKLWQGTYEGLEEEWLRWYGPDGNLIPTEEEIVHASRLQVEQALEDASEARQEASEARQEASEARQEASEARQQAETLRLRQERLLAQLRALGVAPETDEPS